MKKASCYSILTIMVLLMVVAVFTYVAPHIGWRVNAVLSGSMEPALKVGSLVVTHPVEPKKVEVGDMIAFNPVSVGENMITHRVIGVAMNSPIHFATKGDANDKPDPFTVPEQNLVGKVCLHIPSLGYFTQFLKTPTGFILSIVVPGIVVFIMYLVNVWRTFAVQKKQGVAI